MLKHKAFTLIELMVVVSIIGVLTAIVVPGVSKLVDKARITRTAAELTAIKHAMNIYLADTGSYPPTVQDWGRPWGADVGLVERGSVVGGHLSTWNGPYLESWPNRTAWGGAVGCGAQGAYYIHTNIGWINRDGIGGNDLWIHMNPYCVRYHPSEAIVIDAAMDDGDPNNGNMRLTGGWPEYVYYYAGEGPRSW